MIIIKSNQNLSKGFSSSFIPSFSRRFIKRSRKLVAGGLGFRSYNLAIERFASRLYVWGRIFLVNKAYFHSGRYNKIILFSHH
ncbi:hypothetical protein C5167_039331 [Papaver somniferum]|uniref:Uncharacterized protein n=1 Tax=Papaver somniferum TaxID=3469 RepID=A0A4Y7IFB3_PAPSO|nr:hypothetical protein C5167_039331 [Papaver somniferum]